MSRDHPRSSRQQYRRFVDDYRKRRLDDAVDDTSDKRAVEGSGTVGDTASAATPKRLLSGSRRRYAREYLRWLKPHRYEVGFVFVLALIGPASR
jgi:hypothetical protein